MLHNLHAAAITAPLQKHILSLECRAVTSTGIAALYV